MSSIPYMPWYPDTHLSKTCFLSLEEQGALRLLFDHMWLHDGWLIDNDKRVARMLRVSVKKWLKLKKELASHFQYNDGSFTNRRLLNEYSKAKNKIEKLSANGKLGAEKCKENKRVRQANAPSPPFSRQLGQALTLPFAKDQY